MCKFIGQTKLINTFSSCTLQTLPKTMLFIGEEGCGKHTLAKYITEKFELEYVEVPADIDYLTIMEYNQVLFPTLYYIDLSNFLEKQQNKLLKFIEEPAMNTFICIGAISEACALPTILNRCLKYIFEPYSIEELRQIKFINKDYIYEICTTPGQLKKVDYTQIEALYSQCKYYISNLKNMTYAQFLQFSTLVNYKEFYNKFEFYTTCNMLKFVALSLYKEENNEFAFKVYQIVEQYMQKFIKAVFVKESFMISMLDSIWRSTH